MQNVHSNSSPGFLPAQIGNEGTLPPAPLEYLDRRVLTTARAASAFQVDEKLIQTNFSRNSTRFRAGVHFHKVDGAELRALKNEPSFSGFVGKNASHLILWTDRGIARHAKILETDTAWEIYEQLEETYFAVRDGRLPDNLPLPKKLKAVADVMSGFSRLIGLLGVKGNQRAISAAQATYRETGVNVLELTGVTHLKAEVQELDVTPKAIGERLNPVMNAKDVNLAMEAMGLQVAHRYTRKGRKVTRWELTDAGKATGAHYDDTSKKHMSGTSVLQIKWTANVIPMVQTYFDGRLVC